jgi:hypothetical protein
VDVYFAGLNTEPIAAALEGRRVLMSFADVTNGHGGVIAREVLPRLQAGLYSEAILDSGAFSVQSGQAAISVEDYGRFAVEHQALFGQVVNLDHIGGDLRVTWTNQAYLEGLGLDVIPVFHQDEPLAVLDHYAERYRRIGIGFARTDKGRLKYGRKVNRAWLQDVFDQVPPEVEVHGFAMIDWGLRQGFGAEFATTDSTTWVRGEFTALGRECEARTAHGCKNAVAKLMRKLGRDLRYKLVLDSYHQAGGEPCGWFDQNSKGQARTVFNRYSRRELYDWFRANGVDAFSI